MLPLKSDQKVLGYLGRALSLELSAVQLYSTHARVCNVWGLTEAAKAFREEAASEMLHVDKLIARMLALGVAPGASQLRPVKLGSNLSELLSINMGFEQDIVLLYSNAVEHCNRIADIDARLLFQELLDDERKHFSDLAAWQKRLLEV
jgi:bacterioferritin